MDRTVPEREEVRAWEAGLRALHQQIGRRFGRREPRQRALAYLKGLLGSVERKNGWQLTEYVDDATPDGVQLADRMVELGLVTSLTYETVRLKPKKTSSSPGGSNSGASPR